MVDPLPAVVDDVSKVPEALRDYYEEAENGNFRLNASGIVLESEVKTRIDAEVDGLRTNRDSFRTQKEALEQELDAFKNAGITLDEWNRMQKDEREKRDKKMIDAGKVDELVDERVREALGAKDEDIKQRDDEIAKRDTLLDRVFLDNAIIVAAKEGRVRAEAVSIVVSMAKEAGWKRDGEKVVLKDAEGRVVYGKDSDPKTAAEWIESLAESQPFLFEESKGSNSEHQNVPPGTPTKSKAKWSNEEKAAYIKKNGSAAYLAIKS